MRKLSGRNPRSTHISIEGPVAFNFDLSSSAFITMTGTTNGTAAPLRPIPNLQRTLWSKDYLRLRAISLLIGIPTRILLTLSYYLKDPLTLRKYQVTRRNISVPSREKGRYIKAILYEPINREKKPLPVHINWHGSGFGECIYHTSAENC